MDVAEAIAVEEEAFLEAAVEEETVEAGVEAEVLHIANN